MRREGGELLAKLGLMRSMKKTLRTKVGAEVGLAEVALELELITEDELTELATLERSARGTPSGSKTAAASTTPSSKKEKSLRTPSGKESAAPSKKKARDAEEDDEDERPAKKKARDQEEDDEDERPAKKKARDQEEDDEDERPAKKKPRSVERDDSEESERPKKRPEESDDTEEPERKKPSLTPSASRVGAQKLSRTPSGRTLSSPRTRAEGPERGRNNVLAIAGAAVVIAIIALLVVVGGGKSEPEQQASAPPDSPGTSESSARRETPRPETRTLPPPEPPRGERPAPREEPPPPAPGSAVEEPAPVAPPPGPSTAPPDETPRETPPETPPKTPAPKAPPKNPPRAPKPDPAPPPKRKLPETGEDPAIAEKAASIRTLLNKDPADLAGAARIVSELEKLAPDSPSMRCARGIVAFYQRRYLDCQDDLAVAIKDDPEDEWPRGDLACALLFYGKTEQARTIAAEGKNHRCTTVVTLVDGPWKEKYPLAHPALEQKTSNGRYDIVSDLGLPPGALDKLEAELAQAKPDKQRALIERFRKAHAGLQELTRVYDAAYKAYMQVFGKIKRDPVLTKKEEGRVARVFVFETKDEYGNFAEKIGHGRMEHTAGFFSPSYKSLFFFNNPVGAKPGSLYHDTQETLFHETFHQFIDLYCEDIPNWFNEGMAEFFGISDLQGQTLHYGIIPQGEETRYQELLYFKRKGRLHTIHDVIRMDDERFMKEAGPNYALAWAFCHFLANDKTKRKRLNEYFRDLRAGKTQEELARKWFPDEAKLQTDFEDYIGHMANSNVSDASDD
ncbi:DUF1570 domain-containing protein [bacterium]|nr:DUF1570 domain-containing protein [bacterium]